MSDQVTYETLRFRYADPASHYVLNDLRRVMPESGKRVSEDMFSKAVGYGWGRIDSAGYQWPTHGGDALDFGMAFAIHCADRGHTWAIREAFEQWHKTGVIGNE